jgi:hypothetical protein
MLLCIVNFTLQLSYCSLARRDMLPVPQPLQQWQPSPQLSPQLGEQVSMDVSPDRQAPAALHATSSVEARMSRAASVPDATKGGLYTDSGGASTGSDTTPHALPRRPQRDQVSGLMAVHASKHVEMGTDP